MKGNSRVRVCSAHGIYKKHKIRYENLKIRSNMKYLWLYRRTTLNLILNKGIILLCTETGGTDGGAALC